MPPRKRLPAPSIAPDGAHLPRRFRITHPFHPLSRREFLLVTCRHNWAEDRVYFHDDQGRLVSVPTAWTSVSAPDPFVQVAAGRSPFRVQDLLELVRLLGMLREGGAP